METKTQQSHAPWNKGKLVGQKCALRLTPFKVHKSLILFGFKITRFKT